MFCSVEDDILYAVFVEGTGVDKSIPTAHSALCVYPMAAVERIFLDNIEICFRGENDKVFILFIWH